MILCQGMRSSRIKFIIEATLFLFCQSSFITSSVPMFVNFNICGFIVSFAFTQLAEVLLDNLCIRHWLTLGAHAQEGYCSRLVCVCVGVCLLSHISPLERLFILKILSRTQRATEVKKIVGFSLKPLRCGDSALLRWKPYIRSAIFLRKALMRIIVI